MKTFITIFAIMLVAAAFSCKHVVTYDCTGYTPTYTQNVKPILDITCATDGCHGGNDPEEDIDLSTFAGASAASREKSFMGSIQHLPGYHKMPQDADRLTDAQIHMLSCWIENGSPQ
jgi:hypothetical protein